MQENIPVHLSEFFAAARASCWVPVLTLALGFGVDMAVLFGFLPTDHPQPPPLSGTRPLGNDFSEIPGSRSLGDPVDPRNCLAWRQSTNISSAVTAYSEAERSVVLLGRGDPRSLKGASVFGNFFSVLGTKPSLGRGFHSEESTYGSAPVVILSYRLWRQLGSDPQIVGKKINLDQLPYEIVGVLPQGFDYPFPGSDLWLPIKWNLSGKQPSYFRTAHNLRAIARLKPDVSIGHARAALNIFAAGPSRPSSAAEPTIKIGLTPLRDWVAGDHKLPLFLLLGAAAVVLMIACVNVANLQLARASARAGEIALRSSLGATPGRILRQLLSESLLLSLMGGAVGWLLGLWGLRLIVALSPSDLPRISEISPDATVFFFVLAAALFSCVLSGLAPALHSLAIDPQMLHRRGSGGATTLGHHRTRSLLLVVEVTLAAMLMIGAGLLLKSFYRLNRIDPGFEPAHVLTSSFSLPLMRYREENRVTAFERLLLERAGSMPGVQTAALADGLPLQGLRWTGSMTIDGGTTSGPSRA